MLYEKDQALDLQMLLIEIHGRLRNVDIKICVILLENVDDFVVQRNLLHYTTRLHDSHDSLLNTELAQTKNLLVSLVIHALLVHVDAIDEVDTTTRLRFTALNKGVFFKKCFKKGETNLDDSELLVDPEHG